MCAPIEDARHRLKGFLAGCIPDLELEDLAAVDPQSEGAKLHSDRHLMLCLELVVHHSLHETALSDSCVAYDDKLEEMILGSE